MSYKNEIISAFAFKTGKEIERFIEEQNNNLFYKNQGLEALILDWYRKTRDEDFAKHMCITTHTKGVINENTSEIVTYYEKHTL